MASGVEQAQGVMIAQVETGGPADSAGLLMGDIIVSLDGLKAAAVDDLIRLLDEDRIGRGINLDVLRNGKARQFAVTPKERRGS